jgi:hypothetical protein
MGAVSWIAPKIKAKAVWFSQFFPAVFVGGSECDHRQSQCGGALIARGIVMKSGGISGL